MRSIFLVLLLMPAVAQAGDISLVITGDHISGKTIHIALHDSAEGFPASSEHTINYRLNAASDRIELSLPGIEPGYYAISAFADMNDNGKLDTNFFGMPKEPVGVSSNGREGIGSPAFIDASFHVGDGIVRQTINLE